jgi:hypothetical protein
MLEPVLSPLAAWESYYVIVGSSAAALTGLMFVVVALIADQQAARSTNEIAAFGTPTVVHFCAALLTAAVLSAPWRSLANCAIVLGILGAVGVVYMARVLQLAVRQTGYKPVFEDWLWHTILPFVSYVTYFAASIGLTAHTAGALFAIGASTLLLVFIGIHNAWDTVTYVAIEQRRLSAEAAAEAADSKAPKSAG